MADQHPITPPPELVEQWMREAHDQPPGPDAHLIAALAARWGAAQVAQSHPAPVPVAALSSDYREPWDMSSEDGSQCFASAIMSRLVGVDAADETDARWLAAYLQANSRPQHFQPAPVPASERLPGVEDCDAEGRCWWWDGEWGLVEQRFTDYHATHWLPATALPLPQGGGGVMAYPAIGHAVMRVIAWDGVEVHGVPMQSPPDGPQRFIQVFDTEEQAVAFSINEVGMTTPNRPPLWEVMSDACADHPRGVVDLHSAAVAAEIRAVADWIKKARPDYDEVLHGAIRADELDSILALLTTEAERAERGEVE